MGRPARRLTAVVLLLILLLGDPLGNAEAKRSKKKKKKKDDVPADVETTVAQPGAKYAGNVLNGPEASELERHERDTLANADPQGLFNAASVACQEQQHTKCFVGFSLFRERFPELVEGYSNAGVALERMGRLEDAKAIYRKALEKFPGAEKAVGPLLNVLQLEAVQAYDAKNLAVAFDRYKEIVKLAPKIPDAFINLGNIQEGLMEFDGARLSYESAINVDENSVKAHNAICRLMLMEVSGHGAGRFGVTGPQRMVAFERAKVYCAKAAQIAPEDKTANMNLGMLYKESLEFNLAIHHLQKAKETDPNDQVVLTNLATTMSRNDQVPEAVQILDHLIKLNPTPSSIFSMGTILAPYNRLSKKGLKGHSQGLRKAAEAVKIPEGTTCQHDLDVRKWRLSWLAADDVEVEIVEMIDEDSQFSLPGPRTLNNVDLSTTKIGAVPLSFVDKQTIALTVRNVYVEGAGATMYTDCEVFSNLGLSTELARDYRGEANETITIGTPVVSLLHSSIGNYYHWTAESATRLVLSLDYFFGENGVAKDAQLLLPSKLESTFPWEFIETFNLKFSSPPIAYEPGPQRRYKFKTMHRIDWVQLDTEDPEQHDLWSEYLPSRIALERLKAFARAHQQKRAADKAKKSKTKNKTKPSIVYVARSGVRAINNIDILTDYLSELFGKHFTVHDATNGHLDGTRITKLQGQLDIFEHADVILGGHGAGLTNMIYAPDNVSVVEFPMTPHCNRCFGYIAAAFQYDYWIVPEVTCFYHLKYTMTKRKAIAVLKVIVKILEEKGLEHLMSDSFDWQFRRAEL